MKKSLSVSKNDTHPSYFSVERDGKEIAVLNRNGMKWTNALESCLKAGILPREHNGQAIDYWLTGVSNDRKFKSEPIKSPRREPGTAPVSERSMIELTAMVNAFNLDHEVYVIPQLDVEAKAMIKAIRTSHAGKADRPASEAQITFANFLHRSTGLELPDHKTSVSMSAFIGEAKELMEKMPRGLTVYQFPEIDKINLECSRFPNFVPFNLTPPRRYEDASAFIYRWRGFVLPNVDQLKRSEEIAAISGRPVLTQRGEFTRTSVGRYMDLWARACGITVGIQYIKIERARKLMQNADKWINLTLALKDAQRDFDALDANPFDSEPLSEREIYLDAQP